MSRIAYYRCSTGDQSIEAQRNALGGNFDREFEDVGVSGATCGFLVAAGEYLRDNDPGLFRDEKARQHFHNGMFHGFDFDPTMLRIGAMNMTLHGVDTRYSSWKRVSRLTPMTLMKRWVMGSLFPPQPYPFL